MSIEQIKADLAKIPGVDGYAATRDGKIFSLAHNWRGYGIREMAQEEYQSGKSNQTPYLRVRLTINGRRIPIPVHRLIAVTFIGAKPSPAHQIRHLDGNGKNNHVDNLLWGTAKENHDDKKQHGRTLLGKTWSWSRNADRTTCANGHPWNKETARYKGPNMKWRECRVCKLESYHRNKESKLGLHR